MTQVEALFWCVWREGGGAPTVKYEFFGPAKAEAKRLARQYPGSRFVVLAAAVAFERSDLVETRFGDGRPEFNFDDEIPF